MLRDLSITLEAGALLAVSGPNGSGKSTLLRAIAGLLPLSNGQITMTVAGSGGASTPPVAMEPCDMCHYLGHEMAIKLQLTARENLAFWHSLYVAEDTAPAMDTAMDIEAALSALNIVPLASIRVHQLSQGQKKRLALARLLVTARSLWLLDEPLNALDDVSVATFFQIIDAHRQAGGIVVIATHRVLPLDGVQVLRLENTNTRTGTSR